MKLSIYLKTLILIVAPIFYSCEDKQKFTTIDEIYPIIDKIKSTDGVRNTNIRLYVIDSCEYIGYINDFHQDFLTHKGNCKFCTKRNK